MKNKSELHFWVMPNVGFATREILQGFIQEFERQHPDVRVQLTVHPWSLAWNRFMDVIKGRYTGPLPDVLQIGTTWVATLAFLGALEKVPNANVLPQDDAMSAYIWDPGDQNDGSDLFCVPWFIDVRVLYYRRDILTQLGLDPALLEDWKGFTRVCSEIRRYLKQSGPIPKIIAPLGIPGQKPGVLMHDLAPWIWEAGGDFCNEDQMAADLLKIEVMRGCEFYFDLIQQGFMPIPDSTLPPGNFFTGQYAMQFSGSWPVDTYLNPKSELCAPEVAEGFNVALLPAGPEGRFTFLGGSNLGVSSMSENKSLAWEFIRFLSEPDRQLAHARKIGALPARLASMEALFSSYPTLKKVFWDSFGFARRLPRLVELGSIEQIIYKMSGRILSSMRERTYSSKRLHEEIQVANAEMNAVLSLHRYGLKTGNAA